MPQPEPQPQPKPVLEAVHHAVGALSDLVRSIRAANERRGGRGGGGDDVFARLERAWSALKGEDEDAPRDESGARGRGRRRGRARSSGGRAGTRSPRGDDASPGAR